MLVFYFRKVAWDWEVCSLEMKDGKTYLWIDPQTKNRLFYDATDLFEEVEGKLRLLEADFPWRKKIRDLKYTVSMSCVSTFEAFNAHPKQNAISSIVYSIYWGKSIPKVTSILEHELRKWLPISEKINDYFWKYIQVDEKIFKALDAFEITDGINFWDMRSFILLKGTPVWELYKLFSKLEAWEGKIYDWLDSEKKEELKKKLWGIGGFFEKNLIKIFSCIEQIKSGAQVSDVIWRNFDATLKTKAEVVIQMIIDWGDELWEQLFWDWEDSQPPINLLSATFSLISQNKAPSLYVCVEKVFKWQKITDWDLRTLSDLELSRFLKLLKSLEPSYQERIKITIQIEQFLHNNTVIKEFLQTAWWRVEKDNLTVFSIMPRMTFFYWGVPYYVKQMFWWNILAFAYRTPKNIPEGTDPDDGDLQPDLIWSPKVFKIVWWRLTLVPETLVWVTFYSAQDLRSWKKIEKKEIKWEGIARIAIGSTIRFYTYDGEVWGKEIAIPWITNFDNLRVEKPFAGGIVYSVLIKNERVYFSFSDSGEFAIQSIGEEYLFKRFEVISHTDYAILSSGRKNCILNLKTGYIMWFTHNTSRYYEKIDIIPWTKIAVILLNWMKSAVDLTTWTVINFNRTYEIAQKNWKKIQGTQKIEIFKVFKSIEFQKGIFKVTMVDSSIIFCDINERQIGSELWKTIFRENEEVKINKFYLYCFIDEGLCIWLSWGEPNLLKVSSREKNQLDDLRLVDGEVGTVWKFVYALIWNEYVVFNSQTWKRVSFAEKTDTAQNSIRATNTFVALSFSKKQNKYTFVTKSWNSFYLDA